MSKDTSEEKSELLSPFYLLLVVATSIFVTELIVMFILSQIPHLSLFQEAFIDSFILTIFIFPVLYLFVFRPITLYVAERKKAEEAMYESEEKHRTLIESSSDCICHIDLEGRFIYMNPGGVKLNELKRSDELLGKACTMGIKEEYKDFMENALERAKKGNITALEYESININGKNLWWESIVGPIKDDKGNVTSMIRISRDITRKKMAEEKLKKYSDELKQSNKLKDLFIDIMRHDLLNPASAAKNMANLVLKKEEDPDKKEMLEIIFDTNKRIISMVENASILATLESNEKLVVEEKDLGVILESAAKELKPLADEKNTKIMLSTNGGEFKAQVNSLFHNVFSNLINNSIKYGPENSEVVVGIEDDDSKWKISVADNGKGIPDEYKVAIFDRFKRVKKGGVKGTGLGLAIVKKVVEAHNGKVWVEDNPDGGSIFNIKISKG